MAVVDALQVEGVTALNLTRIAGAPTTLVIKGDKDCLANAGEVIRYRLARDASLEVASTFLGTALLLELTDDSD
jgi:hypothetical protein